MTITHSTPGALPRLRSTSWLPSAAIATVAGVWGVTFTVVDTTTTTLPAPDLVLWRFGLAALVLAVMGRRAARLPAQLHVRSVVLGLLLGSGFLLQAWALAYTDALMSGFLTGLLVVVAPIAARVLFGERLGVATWFGVALAGVGVAVLGFHATGFGPGELLTIASAAVWGLHLVLMSRWSRCQHACGMARIQVSTVAGLAALVVVGRSAFTGASPMPTFPADTATWSSVAFLALVATAAAMVILSWAQSRVSAARAAVILTLEPAVSGLTATLTGSALTGRIVVGAVLLVAAMAAVELVRRPPGEAAPEATQKDSGEIWATGVENGRPAPSRG